MWSIRTAATPLDSFFWNQAYISSSHTCPLFPLTAENAEWQFYFLLIQIFQEERSLLYPGHTVVGFEDKVNIES